MSGRNVPVRFSNHSRTCSYSDFLESVRQCIFPKISLMNFGRWILGVFGWKVTGDIPHHLKKFVVIAAPHTSGWDFPLGVFGRSAIGRHIKFIGKKRY